MRRLWFLVVLVFLLFLVFVPSAAQSQFPHGFADLQHTFPNPRQHGRVRSSPRQGSMRPGNSKIMGLSQSTEEVNVALLQC